MQLTILGSGGCTVVPRPLCPCAVCQEAREKGGRFVRTGPSAFLHDANLLIDAPAEVGLQLNRERIDRVEHLILTHLDPDHVEGLRVVEQITLDFRTWRAYPDRRIRLLLPEPLAQRIHDIRSIYGPLLAFYEQQGFVETVSFRDRTRVDRTEIAAFPVDRGDQVAFVYVLEQGEVRLVYAPCDIRPFPEERSEVREADLLVIQPGIFEDGLPHGFRYPPDHISRRTLYTFEETLAVADRIGAKQVLFTHLEEYWNRSYADYLALEAQHPNIRFAYDGMIVEV